MSKEMTPKEAINRIIENLPTYKGFLDDITVVTQSLSELKELKRDVARYFELYEQAREKWGNGLDDVEAYEYTKLHIKLSKVGMEELK